MTDCHVSHHGAREGHGESDGEFFDTNITNDLTDTRQTLDRIASFDFVDCDILHLLGFSLVAVIAGVVPRRRVIRFGR